MNKSAAIISVIIALSFAISAMAYGILPDRIASHWNAAGEADGYMPKFWGLLPIPLMLMVFGLLFAAIPRIDPLRANIEKFIGYYEGFIMIFFIFMLAVQVHIILWNSGTRISPNLTFPLGMGALFYYIGILCSKAKRNWFIGIRTPWTLSSDRVWDRTHQLAGKLYKIAGIISLFGAFFGVYAFLFILVPVIAVSIYTVVYSYVEYKRENKGHPSRRS